MSYKIKNYFLVLCLTLVGITFFQYSFYQSDYLVKSHSKILNDITKTHSLLVASENLLQNYEGKIQGQIIILEKHQQNITNENISNQISIYIKDLKKFTQAQFEYSEKIKFLDGNKFEDTLFPINIKSLVGSVTSRKMAIQDYIDSLVQEDKIKKTILMDILLLMKDKNSLINNAEGIKLKESLNIEKNKILSKVLLTKTVDKNLYLLLFLITILSLSYSLFQNKTTQGQSHQLIDGNIDLNKKNKDAETLLKKRELQLAELSQAATVGELLSGVAQELKSYFSVIHSQSAMISKKSDDKEFVQNNSIKITETSEKLSSFINNLLAMSDSTKISEYKKISVKALIEDTLIFCNRKFIGEEIRLDISEIDPSLYVYCNTKELTHVLLSLLNNSYEELKTSENSEKWIKITTNYFDNILELKIVDSGNGIEPSIASEIFSAHYSTKEDNLKTGLGLSTARKIVSNHEGRLFYSSEDKNTTFVISLPCSKEKTLAA